eukprot:GHRR01026494.1.p1 GENE.GHRR01026494.1~~GHRR01026494.1.p1  ORF type:complete len:109 (+),score=26.96 GHRR01026494.1:523-849(+)
MHLAARKLNKQGRYEEAQAKYAEMRRLDASALEATQILGCPSGRIATLGDDGAVYLLSAPAEPNPVYHQLHSASAWPTSAAATGTLLVPERAYGAILGCLMADVAAKC